ncbi:MAG: hypothetical protein B6I24_08910 [Bacteroidetes bacterium 4572_128]|nr:MAG: hypothetical protein B6I24_08910 [Bacteroidetes bacterium 4572_128]
MKEVQASVDKVYETFKENHLTVENFLDKRINETLTKLSKELWSKADGYGMTYKVPTLLQNHEVYLLDDKTKDLYSPEIDSNTFEKIWISATKYGINKVQTDIVKLVITTEITGYTLQFIYGDLEEVIDYNKTIVVPTYSMKILKNGTEVEQDFHITRDGWYSRGIIDEGFFFDDVQLTNRHFEPRDGDVNLYSTIPLEYPPDSDLEAYTLTQCGKRGLEAEPITEEMNTRIEEEFNDARKNLGIARGIMIHIGGFYYNAHYQQNKLAGSYGCFGFIPKHQIFNTKEKAEECRVNGSYTNWEVSNKDYNEYMAKVIKLKGKGALVRVVIQKRKTVEKLRILKNQ